MMKHILVKKLLSCYVRAHTCMCFMCGRMCVCTWSLLGTNEQIKEIEIKQNEECSKKIHLNINKQKHPHECVCVGVCVLKQSNCTDTDTPDPGPRRVCEGSEHGKWWHLILFCYFVTDAIWFVAYYHRYIAHPWCVCCVSILSIAMERNCWSYLHMIPFPKQ